MMKTLLYIGRARVSRMLGRAPGPHLMTWNVTDRCNARCAMCEIHKWKTAATDELTVSDFGGMLSSPELENLDVIRLTGGEPFIRNDLAGLVAEIADKTAARIVYVTTNGSFPERVESFVKAACGKGPAIHLQVSMDALDETHDRMRGVPGMLERTRETVMRLYGLKNKYDFYAGINQTVTSESFEHIEPVAEFARSRGLGHHLFLGAQFHEGKTMEDVDPSRQEVTFAPQDGMGRDEMEKFYRVHAELKARRRAGARKEDAAGAFLRELSEEYLNEGGRNRAMGGRAAPKPLCMAMTTHFRLTAAGDVVSCSVYRRKTAGNVKEKSFSEIWNGDGARGLRKTVRACRGCWIECDINPSIFFSGDIIPWYLRRVVTDSEFRKNYFPPPRI